MDAADDEAWQDPGWYAGRPCSDDALEDLKSCDAAPNVACALARVKATCLEDEVSYTWVNCAYALSRSRSIDVLELLTRELGRLNEELGGNVSHAEQLAATEDKVLRRTLKNRRKRVLRELRSLKAYIMLFRLPGLLDLLMILLNLLSLYLFYLFILVSVVFPCMALAAGFACWMFLLVLAIPLAVLAQLADQLTLIWHNSIDGSV